MPNIFFKLILGNISTFLGFFLFLINFSFSVQANEAFEFKKVAFTQSKDFSITKDLLIEPFNGEEIIDNKQDKLIIYSYSSDYFADLPLLNPQALPPEEEEAKPILASKQKRLFSGNPAASDSIVGTGELGKWLGLGEDSPVRIGGIFLGNITQQISGGTDSGTTSFNGSAILGLGIDLEKAMAWPGAFFEVEVLQFNGQPVNQTAGSVQGINSLEATSPLSRTELYQLWLNQTFNDGRISFRVGKLIPSMNFGSVVRPLITQTNPQLFPSTTSLMYTPVFVSPSMLGFIPGYYNSAFGIYGSWNSWGTSFENGTDAHGWYVQAGLYDGRGAQGVQTGLVGPDFSGALFEVIEVGGAWSQFPGISNLGVGSLAVGAWHQSGPLTAPGGATEAGTGGIYGYLVQKLGTFRDDPNINGVMGFLQGGWNNSSTAIMNASVGFGLTFIAPFADRPLDSYGLGFSWAELNDSPAAGYGFNSYETMIQFYGQYHLFSNYFLQPVITILPTPGIKGATSPSISAALQLVVPF